MTDESTSSETYYVDIKRFILRQVKLVGPIWFLFIILQWLQFGMTHNVSVQSSPAGQRYVVINPIFLGGMNPLDAFMFNWFPLLVTVWPLIIWPIYLYAVKRPQRPAVSLSSEGLTIYFAGKPVGPIPWSNISSVTVEPSFMKLYLQVFPISMDAIYPMMSRNQAWACRYLLGPPRSTFIPGYRRSPLRILDAIGIKQTELLARIQAYHERYRYIGENYGEGVWPPAPSPASL